MRDQYLKDIMLRGNELALLEQAALSVPEKVSPVRWMIAAAFFGATVQQWLHENQYPIEALFF